MLKLVHAKRMLPLEELLSGAKLENSSAAGSAPSGGGAARTTPPSMSAPRSAPPSLSGRPTPPPSGPIGGPRTATPPSRPSPFEADKARKSKTDLSGGDENSDAGASPAPVAQATVSSTAKAFPTPMATMPRTMTSAFPPKPQPAKAEAPSTTPVQHGTAVAVAIEQPVAETGDTSIEAVRDAVLSALEATGSRMAVASLEEGEWSVAGAVVNVVVAMSAAMIDVTFGVEQKKLAASAATKVIGRPMRFNIVSGTPKVENRPSRKTGGGGNVKGRAADEPLVKKMMEKFGAEIRTVIDQS
jgi:DNA polymerase III subunit gamma/tau